MKASKDHSNITLRAMFWEAGNTWDLAKLYHDLGDIKGEPLTELELACMRGLLLYGDRQKVAGFLAIDPETLREILNSSLYLYISKLTDTNNVTSRSIPQLLADRGYQLGTRKLLAIFKKFLPGAIITISTGILVNILAAKLTRQANTPKANVETTVSPSVPQINVETTTPPCQKFDCITVNKKLILYGGSTSWVPIRKVIENELPKYHPELKLEYKHPSDGKPSSGKGVRMLLDGEIDIALISRPLTDKAYEMATKRGVNLKEIKIARNAGAVIVNKGLSIPGLTVEEVQGIYTGKITNWQEVGGPNLPIQPLIRLDTLDGFTKPFLGEEVIGNLTQKVQKVKVVTTGIKQVSKTPGAIFLGSAGLMIKQCSIKVLPIGERKSFYTSPAKGQNCPYQLDKEAISNRYPSGFTTFLSLVYNENDQRSKEAGQTLANLLLTDEGQQLIDGEADFVRIQ